MSTAEIRTKIYGPLQNNTFLLIDTLSSQAVIIDPAIGSYSIIDELINSKLTLYQIWITHAHFDHIAGAERLSQAFQPKIPIAIHAFDTPLWQAGGGAKDFGFQLDPGPVPEIPLHHQQKLFVGDLEVEVRHTPGHTPGHAVFFIPILESAIVGDLIFFHGIGRTDTSGGDHAQLISSIHSQIFSLPLQTKLYPGHGKETTVTEELNNNPFLK